MSVRAIHRENLNIVRRQELLANLKDAGQLTTVQLALSPSLRPVYPVADWEVRAERIRRDLKTLEAQGLAERTHRDWQGWHWKAKS